MHLVVSTLYCFLNTLAPRCFSMVSKTTSHFIFLTSFFAAFRISLLIVVTMPWSDFFNRSVLPSSNSCNCVEKVGFTTLVIFVVCLFDARTSSRLQWAAFPGRSRSRYSCCSLRNSSLCMDRQDVAISFRLPALKLRQFDSYYSVVTSGAHLVNHIHIPNYKFLIC